MHDIFNTLNRRDIHFLKLTPDIRSRFRQEIALFSHKIYFQKQFFLTRAMIQLLDRKINLSFTRTDRPLEMKFTNQEYCTIFKNAMTSMEFDHVLRPLFNQYQFFEPDKLLMCDFMSRLNLHDNPITLENFFKLIKPMVLILAENKSQYDLNFEKYHESVFYFSLFNQIIKVDHVVSGKIKML